MTQACRRLVREFPCAPSTAFAALARLRALGLVEDTAPTSTGFLLLSAARDKEATP